MRACLIVDHPLRDLDGLVLLATELVDRDIEAFLVPMYQRHEVFWLQPDVVLVNYVRFANVGFVEACNRAGIRVAVLDTEGGVQQDIQAFADRVARHLGGVALYCAWGTRQRDAIADRIRGDDTRVIATGSPRYDFAVPPLVHAVRDPQPHAERFVLVNTNFPIINPRFQTVRRELHDLIHGMGYEEAFIREFIRQSRIAQAGLVDAVSALASRSKGASFIVRPHPFEHAHTYEKFLAQISNVHVIQAGTVLE
ncbi:MAG: surface carbohydrate biosynthesis protein, partial [Candidatus Methylomirabilis sp.]